MQKHFIRIIATGTIAFLLTTPARGDASQKEVRETRTIGINTQLTVPDEFGKIEPMVLTFREKEFTLKVFSRGFAQGEAIYFEILPPESGSFASDFSPTAFFRGNAIPVEKREWGFNGLFDYHVFLKTGKQNLKVGYKSNGKTVLQKFQLPVEKTIYAESRSSLDLGKYSRPSTYNDPEVIKKIQYGVKRKKQAFASRQPDHLDSHLSHPRDLHHVTSSFNTRRVKERYVMEKGKKKMLKPKIRYHRGLDLRGRTGDPIYAMARGRVVLAEELYFEGKFTLIDHGNGIMTAFMHQDSILVKEGDMVEAGQLVGRSGATGAVTGAHLHVSLYIRRSSVDPMSLLFLPIRN